MAAAATSAPAPADDAAHSSPAGKTMPPWRMPAAGTSIGHIFRAANPLRVLNSLTRTKVPFVPMRGRDVYWYACGPTVYGPSHMGHARTYVCFDVLRRIMRDHFGFRVVLIMNITDIDDKIINRANEEGVPFTDVAVRFEREFLEDMTALGVEPADEMPRVSEHVPEVIEFISTIMAKGFAYEAEGSVYFDTVAYSSKHRYGKLMPENVGNEASALEGEGALGKGVAASSKRNGCDFALWKAAKPEEPSWESPWGPGRPGWHIECSAMASDALRRYGTGGAMDIHSGGVDLKFPHHDNEIAQSEACLGCHQWVNYFLHSGHLNIRGLKMGKSLKNFTTIRAALERYPARHLRLLFLSFRYNVPLNYSPEMMDEVASKDKTLNGFFENVQLRLRVLRDHHPTRVLSGAALLNDITLRAQTDIDAALADDFDTPTALACLFRVIAAVNLYLESPETLLAAESASAAAAGGARAAAEGASAGTAEPVNAPVLRRSAAMVTKVARLFGLIDPALTTGIGASVSGGSAGEAESAAVIDALAEFRERVREAARSGDKRALFDACDWVRDAKMAALGVKLEDVEGAAAAASWKRADPEALREEIRRRALASAEAAEREAEAAADKTAEAGAKAALIAIPPARLFMDSPKFAGQFSEYDETGMPTKTAAGEGVSKKQSKKLIKARDNHIELRAKNGVVEAAEA